ncbi:hypothetical protein FF38_11646 [Lucilia cuprina]|uniref:Uncharacterized protein n=1 Tax=Lucilia cuprina TaxID=7375 RepID=A0A0L0CGK5_LUCCU|nr:hypothetical protein FF38_11646 [Lucilia cuprina]
MILNDGIVLNTFLPDPDFSNAADDVAVVSFSSSTGCSIKENNEIFAEDVEDETASIFDVASTTDNGDNNGADVVVFDVVVAAFIVGYLCNVMAFVRVKPVAPSIVVFVLVDVEDNDDFLLLFFINSDII